MGVDFLSTVIFCCFVCAEMDLENYFEEIIMICEAYKLALSL